MSPSPPLSGMRFTLLVNGVAFALFTALAACSGLLSWRVLVFQLLVQLLTNEFWLDIFMLPFRGQQLFGVEPGKSADPARMRCVARWTCGFVLLFPALVLTAMGCIDFWGEGALARGLQLPLGGALFSASLLAQGLLLVATLAGGLVPLSYRTVIDALMARHERRLQAEGRYPKQPSGAHAAPPPTRAGVQDLPHGLPGSLRLPACLMLPQPCSPLHAEHISLVRAQLREGEYAVLSTAPAGVVALPRSSHERLWAGLGLCAAAVLLHTALGIVEEAGPRAITAWVVLLSGLGLLAVGYRVLRAASRRQALLQRMDYIITNRRLHVCCNGQWCAYPLVSAEVQPGRRYGEGRGDVMLCPDSGTDPCTLVNVEHAEELRRLLEDVVAAEKQR